MGGAKPYGIMHSCVLDPQLHKMKEVPKRSCEFFFFFTAHRRHMAKQAQASTKPHGPKDYAGATGLNFAQSSAGSPESSQLSEPAWWLHAFFGRRPFPWKQFVQAVSAGGQATRPRQSIPRRWGRTRLNGP